MAIKGGVSCPGSSFQGHGVAALRKGTQSCCFVAKRLAATFLSQRNNQSVPKSALAEANTATFTTDLPKNFDLTQEERIYRWWEEQGYFSPDPSSTGEPFVISMPPPNVTGRLHMGHAMFVTLQDIMIRVARMRGRPTLWLPGTDHAGIATQSVVEKMLTKEGVSRLQMGREAFEARVWEWKKEYGGFITHQMRRLGASCDWSRERFTLDTGMSEAVMEAFVRLHERGLIYRGSYMVNWSPALLTAVSDLEVEYGEEPGHLYYFRYPIADAPGEFIPVATTRPETILGDTAVAVNPEDPRYAAYIGREALVPFLNRRIKVIADDYVDKEFGTGALKITPGHDINDYEIGKRHGLEVINIMNKDASLNAAAGPYAGLDRFEARKRMWSDLEAAGLAIKKENHTLRVPRSQRGGEVVEPLVSAQWFVRMEGLAEPALVALKDGQLSIMPERFGKIYTNWLDGIKDWCISRQLWWGHRIPVWYVFSSAAEAAASPDGRSDTYIVARSEAEARAKVLAEHGSSAVLQREEDVLDTWFSSGLWPFSTLGWPNEAAADFQKFYPTQVMETGHDILFFWVARMVMLGLALTGRLPFSLVYLHGLVRDEAGRKMSKSLGNVIDPLEVVSEMGTDALRFTLATGTGVGQDLNLSMERVTANRNFTNKLWNAGKFVLFQLTRGEASEASALAVANFESSSAVSALPLTERWVVSALHQLIDDVTSRLDRNDFNEAGRATYSFVWDEFADWFVEASKARGSNATLAAANRGVLVYVMDRVLKLLHPYMPFVTEELWQALPHTGSALIAAPWPAVGSHVDSAALSAFSSLKGIVRSVRNARAEYGIEAAKKIGGSIVVQGEALRSELEREKEVICLLAKLDSASVQFLAAAPDSTPASGAITLVVEDGVQVIIPLAGVFDVAKELARLQKQRAKLEKQLSGVTAQLSNPGFLAKASPEVVADVSGSRDELTQQMEAVAAKMEAMKAMA